MNFEAPSIDLPVESKEEGPLANGGPTNEQLTISNFVLSLSHKSIKPVLCNKYEEGPSKLILNFQYNY